MPKAVAIREVVQIRDDVLDVEYLPIWKPIKGFPDKPQEEVEIVQHIHGCANLEPGPVMLGEAIRVPPIFKLSVVAFALFRCAYSGCLIFFGVERNKIK